MHEISRRFGEREHHRASDSTSNGLPARSSTSRCPFGAKSMRVIMASGSLAVKVAERTYCPGETFHVPVRNGGPPWYDTATAALEMPCTGSENLTVARPT